MPKTLTIHKDAASDKVRLEPSPLEVLLSDERRIEIVAGEDLKNLSGADKSIKFEFVDAASKDMFDAPSKPPFTLQPGEKLSLKVKGAGLPPVAKRSAAKDRFKLDADGHPDSAFTLTADLKFLNRERAAGHGHSDMHLEC